MIQLTITAASKGYRPSDTYNVFDERKKTFPDMETAKAWLREEYGTCKRIKMYRDTDGVSHQVGWIYCYRNDDISHLPIEKWLQQDWIEFEGLHPVDESELRGR